MSSWPVKTVVAALILALVAGGAAYKMREHDQIKYNALKAEYERFKGGVAALGEAATKAVADEVANGVKLKARTDDENKRVVASLRADIRRLRDDADRARGSHVPAAGAGAVRPDLACFDRAALESALRGLVAEVRGLVDEGAEATVNLNAAKLWNTTREK